MVTDYADIYQRVQKVVTLRRDSDVQQKIAGWITQGTSQRMTSSKSRLVNTIYNRYQEEARDIVDKYVNNEDIKGLKRETFEDSELAQIRDNQYYNLAARLFRDARDRRDVSSLRSLREQIKGTVAEDDWTIEIDRSLERLNE